MTNRHRMIGLLCLVAVAAVGAFIAGRVAGPGGGASAVPGEASPVEPGAATPQPGTTPDTSRPLWYLPYMEADDRLPRYDQTIAGIAVGPSVEVGGYDPKKCVSALIEVLPLYVPAGASVSEPETFSTNVCGDRPVRNEATYRIPPDEADLAKVDRGEKSFFDAKHGGYFTIYKRFIDVPAWRHSFPGERVHPASINGHPAAFVQPLFPEGFGQSMILVWEAETGVLTVLTGVDMPWSEMLRIAEGVVSK